MSHIDYERGIRDGKHNSFAGKPRASLMTAFFSGYSEKQLDKMLDWKQGFAHGRKQQKQDR